MKNKTFKSFAQVASYLLLLAPVALAAQLKAPETPAAPASTASTQPAVAETTSIKKEKSMDKRSNREKAEKAFRDWQNGTGSITDLLADDLRWTIVGRSQVSKTFNSKEQFVGEVLQPFGARFSQTFRPVTLRGVYADGDTVIVVWDGEGIRRDGKPYKNTYAWFMRFHEGLVVEATAFFDSIAFNELWSEVTPMDKQKLEQAPKSETKN
jgi:hypothetical protein